MGHPDYVARHLQSVVQEHPLLLDRIPRVKDLQSAWLLLLHCASARANYMLRAVDPDRTGEFARAHDEGTWQCACDILQIEAAQTDTVRSIASLTVVLGGLGLRSAEWVRSSAKRANWADCIPTIDARHLAVAESLVRELEGHPHTPCRRAAQEAARSLEGVLGWSLPSWFAVLNGAGPDTHQTEEFEPGGKRG